MSYTQHAVKTGSHTTAYLAAGPEDGPLVIFVHGWPELSLSWRHQLPVFGALGFRAIAPDLRGYGGSSVYDRHEDYAQERVVGDLIGLLDALVESRPEGTGRAAIWVGHDWGAPVVWNVASHHPERVIGVAGLCVPYRSLELGLDATIELVDRKLYPADQYPNGQWDYQRFYEESFDVARAGFEANVENTVKLLFRRGSPEVVGKPAGTASTRANGGWFGPGGAPDVPRDSSVLTEEDQCAYVAALTRTGFFGADSFYMNHTANAAYAQQAVNGGVLEMPALFVGARFDAVCETTTSDLAQPMRGYCRRLTERVIDAGHWVAQEKPRELNAALTAWLVRECPQVWPGPRG